MQRRMAKVLVPIWYQASRKTRCELVPAVPTSRKRLAKTVGAPGFEPGGSLPRVTSSACLASLRRVSSGCSDVRAASAHVASGKFWLRAQDRLRDDVGQKRPGGEPFALARAPPPRQRRLLRLAITPRSGWQVGFADSALLARGVGTSRPRCSTSQPGR